MGWIVYSKDGQTERCVLHKLEYSGTFMGDRSVIATFSSEKKIDFNVFDYITYRGERFELELLPTVKKVSSREYKYELRFVSLKYELERCMMRNIVPGDNGIVYPTPLTVEFTGDVRYLAERIQACMDAMYGKNVWSITVADGTESDEKNISMSNQNCWDALSLVNTEYKLNYFTSGRSVTIGGADPVVDNVFEYGKGKGLYEIERVSDADTGVVTKLRAYGGTRNLDYSYPKKPEWKDSVLPANYALSPLRLMLPSFKTDGVTDFVLASDEAIARYGIREGVMTYDDIYPSITGMTNSSGQAVDEIKAVSAITDENQPTFTVQLYDLGFDLNDSLTTGEAQVAMKSGALQGYSFTVTNIEKASDNSYTLTLGRNTLEEGDTDNFTVPNKDWNMKAGDKFVLLNILMPQEYIRDAENRLLARAQEYLSKYSATNYSYTVGVDEIFMARNVSFYNDIMEGKRLTVNDTEMGIDHENIIIQSLTIKEGERMIPTFEVTLNNEPGASTLERIQGQVSSIEASVNNKFSSQSELSKQYRKKLDKSVWDSVWEIREDELSKQKYIFGKLPVVTQYGVTMYADGNELDLPSIYDGLPIDNVTIKWSEGADRKLTAVSSGGSETLGGLTNVGSWADTAATEDRVLFQPKGGTQWSGKQLSEIAGTISGISFTGEGNALTGASLSEDKKSIVFAKSEVFAKKSELDVFGTKLDNFLEGSDTDGIINKWKELESFLAGQTQTSTLSELLSVKADKATTLEGYGITDAYTETELNDKFKEYVTVSTTQDVTGLKDFTNGVKIGGVSISKHSDGIIKIDGDLVLTGGVTMYAQGSHTASTILDALPIDNTLSKAGGVLSVVGGGGSSISGIKVNSGTYSPDSSGYITIPDYPTSLKNPYSLTVTLPDGSTTVSYDGSAAKSVTLTRLYKASEVTTATSDDGTVTPLAMNNWTKGQYVAALGTSGNYLTWTKNGVANSITVPYATNSLRLILMGTKDWNGLASATYNGIFGYIDESTSGRYDAYGSVLQFSNVDNPSPGTNGNWITQLISSTENRLGVRWRVNTGSWSAVQTLLTSSNYTSYVTKIGTSTVGSASKPVYLSSGVPTACSYSFGNASGNAALNNGTVNTNLNADMLDGVHLQNIMERQYSGAATSTAAGYYRIGKTTSTDVTGISFILMVNHNYSYSNTECYTFSVNITGGGYCIVKQLSGIWNDVQLDKIRITGTTGGYYYVDVHINTSHSNSYYWTSFGNLNSYRTWEANATALTNSSEVETSLGSRTVSFKPNSLVSEQISPSITAGMENAYAFGVSASICNRAYMSFYYAGNGSTSNRISFGLYGVNNLLNILGNGNVGIGTTSPTEKLHVNGNIIAGGGRVMLSSSDKKYAFYLTNGRLCAGVGPALGFNAGNLLVSSAWSDYTKVPANGIYCKGDITNEYYNLKSSTTNPYLRLALNGLNWYVQAFNNYMYFGYGVANSLRIDTSGNVLTIGGITMYSDLRKKDIVKDIILPLDKITEAPLFSYTYKSDESRTLHIGTSAQYWEDMPGIVRKDGEGGYLTMDYNAMLSASVLSLARYTKQHETEIDRLKRENKDMRKRIEELERRVA